MGISGISSYWMTTVTWIFIGYQIIVSPQYPRLLPLPIPRISPQPQGRGYHTEVCKHIGSKYGNRQIFIVNFKLIAIYYQTLVLYVAYARLIGGEVNSRTEKLPLPRYASLAPNTVHATTVALTEGFSYSTEIDGLIIVLIPS